MKKLLSIIISLSIITATLTVAVSATDKCDLGFAVASDLHYSVPDDELIRTNDDSIYWYANRRAELENESGFIIKEFLNQCAKDDSCQFVLISGDLANQGREKPEQHYAVATMFAEFEKTTGKQVFVINGNHDSSQKSTFTFDDFKNVYADFGYNQALTVDENSCSYTADLGDKYRLIALDSNHATKSTADGITTEKLNWVHEQTILAKQDGKYPILIMHHNLLDHMPIQSVISSNFIIKHHYTTAELFANWGIKLVFTGHEHCSDATSYTSTLGNKIYDFATTSLTMYPLQYRKVTLNDEEINYQAKTVDTIDTDKLTSQVKGYTKEQIDLMNSGLNAYAKDFLKIGIKYRMELDLSIDKMDIDEDAFYYPLVKSVIGRLTDLLSMPLYGENSVQNLAKEYGIAIPDSKYKTGWDLATELIGAHYEGEENKNFDSIEVTTLLRMVSLILKAIPAGVSDDMLNLIAGNILDKLGLDCVSSDLSKLGTKVFGSVSGAEYFALAIASPIIYSFAYDSDKVNDNNGTIDGYGMSSISSNIANINSNISYIISKLIMFTQMITNYLQKAIGISLIK